jgi:hypothetical protein
MSDARSIRRRGGWAAGLTTALALFSLSAAAYILPPASILRRMSEARDEMPVSSVRVDGTITFAGSTASEASSVWGAPADRGEVQADAALLLKLPGRCRLEVLASDGGKTAAVWALGKRRSEGAVLTAVTTALDQICPLLAVKSTDPQTRAALERHLQSLKVDTRAASLGRLAGQVAYVLGNPAQGQPQLWVYKDVFLPARVRWPEASGLYDARFIDYGSPVSGEFFPRVMELYRNNELGIRFTGLKADARAQLSDKLF